ncbi:MAG TPA: diguanylate cyclase, partial [Pseudomonas sp.]|nr:diguanylate cyclase [Pseudomonas sp.]
MTHSVQASQETLSIDDELEAHDRQETDQRTERTRLLFSGLRLPLLLMLLASLLMPALLWDGNGRLELGLWSACTLSLAILHLQQGAAFASADATAQARPFWFQGLLLGNVLSALVLGYAMVALVPTEGFLAQTLLYGVLGSVIIAGSVACGVSLWAFLSFTLPCLLPAGLLLLISEQPVQKGWGLLGLIMLLTLGMIAWQINRLVTLSLKQRADNILLIQRLQHVSREAVELNAELAREVDQRRLAERQLREAHDGLE